LRIKKPREGCQGTISVTTLLENPKKDVKRKTKDTFKKYITKKNVKKKIKDCLRKDTTNTNVSRESKGRLKTGDSEAKEVVTDPKPPPTIGPYSSISTGGVGMQRESQYWQPAQQGYAAEAPVHPGASVGYQGYQNKGSNQYQQRTQQPQ